MTTTTTTAPTPRPAMSRNQVVAQTVLAVACFAILACGSWAYIASIEITFFADSGDHWRRLTAQPLRRAGQTAVVLSIVAPIMVWRWRRRPGVCYAATALATALAAMVLTGAYAEVRHNRDLEPELLAELGRLRVPSSWHAEPHSTGLNDPPAVLAVWSAPGQTPQQACADLVTALQAWLGATAVERPGAFEFENGRHCGVGAKTNDRGVEGVVADTTADLVRDRIGGYRRAPDSGGPLIGVELRVRLPGRT